MAVTQYHIHIFRFNEDDRRQGAQVSDVTKIISTGGLVTLRRNRRQAASPSLPDYAYSTQTDPPLYVRSAPFSPSRLKSWRIVELRGVTPKDEEQNAVTAFALRIYNGSQALFWDGVAWSVAGNTNWNTLADFNANLASYTGTTIQVEVRLSTTSSRFTPRLTAVVLAWDAHHYSEYHDLIVHGLKASLDLLRPITRSVVAGNGTTTVSVSEFVPSVVDVVAVYNHTDDPTHATNLLASYASPNVTLTSSPASTKSLVVEYTYAPQVALTTGVQYAETTDGVTRNLAIADAPCIWITQLNESGGEKQSAGPGEHCLDFSQSPPIGVVYLKPPRHETIMVELLTIGRSSFEMIGLIDAIKGWCAGTRRLHLPARDIYISTFPDKGANWDTDTTDVEDTRLTTFGIRLLDVPFVNDPGGQGILAPDPDHPGVGVGVSQLLLNFEGEVLAGIL